MLKLCLLDQLHVKAPPPDSALCNRYTLSPPKPRFSSCVSICVCLFFIPSLPKSGPSTWRHARAQQYSTQAKKPRILQDVAKREHKVYSYPLPSSTCPIPCSTKGGHHQRSMSLYAGGFLHSHSFYYKWPLRSPYFAKVPKSDFRICSILSLTSVGTESA